MFFEILGLRNTTDRVRVLDFWCPFAVILGVEIGPKIAKEGEIIRPCCLGRDQRHVIGTYSMSEIVCVFSARVAWFRLGIRLLIVIHEFHIE